MQSIILLTNENKQIDEFIKKNFSKEDIIISVFPEKTEYSINQIRSIQKEVKYFNPKKRIYVFYDFDQSSLEAQNAFLKLLEEPPENVIFILITENIYWLIPTIASRAKIINLKNNNQKTAIVDEKIESMMNAIKKGNLTLVDVENKEETKKIIMSIVLFFKKQLSNEPKGYLILKEAIRYLSLLENNNLNPQTTLDNLLIFIDKCYNEIRNG